jgi:hypothetical protein
VPTSEITLHNAKGNSIGKLMGEGSYITISANAKSGLNRLISAIHSPYKETTKQTVENSENITLIKQLFGIPADIPVKNISFSDDGNGSVRAVFEMGEEVNVDHGVLTGITNNMKEIGMDADMIGEKSPPLARGTLPPHFDCIST